MGESVVARGFLLYRIFIMSREKTSIFFLLLCAALLCVANVRAENAGQPQAGQKNGLLLEEILVHYDKLFESYLELTKKDMEELDGIVEPLKKKSYSGAGNSELVDSIYIRAQYEHMAMLEKMIEVLYAKLSLMLFIIEPEKKELIERFRKKYESEAEYGKLRLRIDEFMEKINKEKEKITPSSD